MATNKRLDTINGWLKFLSRSARIWPLELIYFSKFQVASVVSFRPCSGLGVQQVPVFRLWNLLFYLTKLDAPPDLIFDTSRLGVESCQIKYKANVNQFKVVGLW